ncbi:MAG: response regulator [Maribacter sp.]|nr:response regulator [Maribacter sp.]
MKAKEILTHLSRMEVMLSDFSFEELTSEEGTHLKKSFNSFKTCLDEMIFKPASIPAPGNHAAISKQTNHSSAIVGNKTTTNSTMLIAKVSHEIRTPLNGIIGFTDLLKEEPLSKKQLSQINAIQSASNSLMEIINELLDYSKLSSGLGNFETNNFNFQNVVNDVVYLCNTLITRKDVRLITKIDSNIPNILLGDPSKLSQVLINLLGNSIKFVEKGEILLNIKIKKRDRNSIHLEFTIKDTGIGISKNNLNHIFDPFKQADQNTFVNYGGSGLGLSIVKQIIERSKGEITVASELGVGTTFKFLLPYKIGKNKGMVKKDESTFSLDEGIKLVKNMNILVFEDNIINQKLIETRLKSWECETFITDDAYTGLDILENHAIDIVLMDLRMPVLNGFEVTGLIRKNHNQSINQVPVIALSADFTAQNKEQCQIHGINDFILKPYSPEELISKLIKNRAGDERLTSEERSLKNQEDDIKRADTKIDLSKILDDCMGDYELLGNLIRLFKQNALEFIGAYRIHIKNKDLEALAFAAHKLKSGLGMLQANTLLSIVEQVQKFSKDGSNLVELEKLKANFLEEYSVVECVIDYEMEKLGNKK